MKVSKLLCILPILMLVVFAGCDSERYATKPSPTPLPLWVAATAIPDTVQIGNPVGLIGDDSGGVAPYERNWMIGDIEIGSGKLAQYTADSIGKYLAWYHVRDAKGQRDSASAMFTVVPKEIDSIPYPEIHVDTLLQVVDSSHIDTLYQVRVDSFYLPSVAYWENNPWILKWEDRSVTLRLNNPEGKFWVHFDRKTLGAEPAGQEYVIRFIDSTCQPIYPEEFFTGYGPNYTFHGVGPYQLPQNVTVTIELKNVYYGDGSGKAMSPTCHDFIQGKLFCFVPADGTQ
jgi:hypothetical protein